MSMKVFTPYIFCSIDLDENKLYVFIAILPDKLKSVRLIKEPNRVKPKPQSVRGFPKKHLYYDFEIISSPAATVPQHFTFSYDYDSRLCDRDGCVYVHVDIEDIIKPRFGHYKCGIGMTSILRTSSNRGSDIISVGLA
jgi:hypothetical protein